MPREDQTTETSRVMTAEERAECERATRELDSEIAAALGDETTEGYEGPIILEWEDGPERPAGLDEIVVADIRQSLWGLAHPADLWTHHIDLTDDHYGPSVHVYGKEGSDAFHCLYCLKTEWVSLKDAQGND